MIQLLYLRVQCFTVPFRGQALGHLKPVPPGGSAAPLLHLWSAGGYSFEKHIGDLNTHIDKHLLYAGRLTDLIDLTVHLDSDMCHDHRRIT